MPIILSRSKLNESNWKSIMRYIQLQIRKTWTWLESLYIPKLKVIFLSILLLFLLPLQIQNSLAHVKKTIAITQIVEHASLSRAKQGVMDELYDSGYREGHNLVIFYKNAQGSIANSLLIAKKFVQLKPDVIIPISTPSSQSIIKSVVGTDIPVVFSSVTDPISAGLVSDSTQSKKSKKNITGVVDDPLIKEVLKLIRYYIPNIKTLGLLYSAGEANSVKTIDLIKNEIKNRFNYIDAQITSSHHLSQAVDSLIGKVDAIYIPSDNTIYSAIPKLVQMSRRYKIPVFSSDPDSVESGIFACIGYTQYEIGRTAGKLLVRVIQGETNLQVKKPDRARIFVNAKTASMIGFDIPNKIMDMKIDVVGLKC